MLPAYPTDANAALELVFALQKEGWSYEVANYEKLHQCEFSRLKRGYIKSEQMRATTPQLAIAECFLKVRGRRRE